MKTVKIPECMNPFEVIVNNQRYKYPGGTEQEVPDEVAEVIEVHMKNHADMTAPPYVPGGGGGGYSTCKVHVSIAPECNGAVVVYSKMDSNGKPASEAIYHEGSYEDIDPSEHDIEVVCGSHITVFDDSYNGIHVQGDLTGVKVSCGCTCFVPIGVAKANIALTI